MPATTIVSPSRTLAGPEMVAAEMVADVSASAPARSKVFIGKSQGVSRRRVTPALAHPLQWAREYLAARGVSREWRNTTKDWRSRTIPLMPDAGRQSRERDASSARKLPRCHRGNAHAQTHAAMRPLCALIPPWLMPNRGLSPTTGSTLQPVFPALPPALEMP